MRRGARRRHGTFELYVGTPLLLVQTMTYGTYPVAAAKLGVAAMTNAEADAPASFEELAAWEMSLEVF